ncbi:MAG: inositol monophosphatase family protein, partial [Phycisphaerae bacterium]
MHQETLARLLEDAKEIAIAAGKAILAIPLEPANVTAKADGSPLTRADLASHETIVSGLALLEPKLPILSEEGDLEAIDPEAWRTFWCVDPLDGTKEF